MALTLSVIVLLVCAFGYSQWLLATRGIPKAPGS